jgi:uncharacterized membrane protein YgcG
MTRKEANKEILRILEVLVEAYPDQRFGQIITNYIFPDYREKDPFYEESEQTLKKYMFS